MPNQVQALLGLLKIPGKKKPINIKHIPKEIKINFNSLFATKKYKERARNKLPKKTPKL